MYSIPRDKTPAPVRRQDSFDSLRPYFAAIAQIPLLTGKQERALFQRVLQGDEKARQEIALANQRLVMRTARQYRSSGLSLDDLIGEGNVGLMRAIDKFELAKNCRFSTYAVHWIRQAVSRAIQEKVHTVRPPVDLTGRVPKYRRAVSRLKAEMGRTPSRAETARELKMSESLVARLNQAELAVRGARPFSTLEGIDDTLHTNGRQNANGLDWLRRIEDSDTLDRLMGHVTSREREVLTLRYGLDGGPPMTLAEVAKRGKVTRARIGQIEQGAIEKMAAVRDDT